MSALAHRGRQIGNSRWGFTLVELVIALGIVAVLTTAAIPSFLRYQRRSRSSEALVNPKAIGTTQSISSGRSVF